MSGLLYGSLMARHTVPRAPGWPCDIQPVTALSLWKVGALMLTVHLWLGE